MSDKWAYSTDGDQYVGEFEHWHEAASEGLDESSGDVVWVGRCEPPTDPENYIDADFLMDHIRCQDEYNHEWAEDWPGATQAQMDELTDAVRHVIAEWIDRHGLAPKFFSIPDPIRVTRDQVEDKSFDLQ